LERKESAVLPVFWPVRTEIRRNFGRYISFQVPDLFLTRSIQGREYALRIGGRPKQVRGFEQARQFVGGNQGGVFETAAFDDHDFAVVGDFVDQRSQSGPSVGICCLNCHGASPFIVQENGAFLVGDVNTIPMLTRFRPVAFQRL
jgi:hypothetical protein